jgi:hypothetical protein
MSNYGGISSKKSIRPVSRISYKSKSVEKRDTRPPSTFGDRDDDTTRIGPNKELAKLKKMSMME